MADTQVDSLTSLHTTLIDTRNGYDEAQKDAEGKGLAPLFRDLSIMHTKSANEVGALLNAKGVLADDNGSFMTTVHKTIIGIRSLFGGLDESILPDLIDGEKRVLGYFDETLEEFPAGNDHDVLTKQRAILATKIGELEARKNMAA